MELKELYEMLQNYLSDEELEMALSHMQIIFANEEQSEKSFKLSPISKTILYDLLIKSRRGVLLEVLSLSNN